MTYEQIVEKVKAKYENANASKIKGTQAIQINLAGKNVEGIFYIEVKDGKVNVEPYDYHDNWATLTIAPTNLIKILDKKMDVAAAYASDKIAIDGDFDTVLRIFKLAK
ncbi:MAG: SCP2 sterol-binding domain-containing protein [Clostridia bacterium]|nr:SCP2 sterol-binding domain-containing protein [Clostridia bacterium]